MTEAEWLSSADPRAMLVFLQERGVASERKLRLFACARRRAVQAVVADPCLRRCIEVAERLADGQVTEHDLQAAFDKLKRVKKEGVARLDFERCASARFAALPLRLPAAFAWQELLAEVVTGDAAGLLHCLFGNPFRPAPSIDAAVLALRDGCIVTTARRIYDKKEFHFLPFLADLLQEAGCQDAAVLGHLRSGAEHVRGCFALDLVLGKE